MFEKCPFRSLVGIAVLVLLATMAQADLITIDLAPVGNPGNADDTHGDGYGGVSDAYNIGTYEVTARYCRELCTGRLGS